MNTNFIIDPIDDEICGLCELPGADKIPHPMYWPDERRPDTDYVHIKCEELEEEIGSNLCQGAARMAFLRNI